MNETERWTWQRSEPIIIETSSEPDHFGRQQFLATWLDNNVGPHCNETGRRGQCFVGVVADHVARWQAQGFDVIVKDDRS